MHDQCAIGMLENDTNQDTSVLYGDMSYESLHCITAWMWLRVNWHFFRSTKEILATLPTPMTAGFRSRGTR